MKKLKISDFRLWMRAMGFNDLQISIEAIGQGNSVTIGQTVSGQRPLTATERLAMSAVRVGLPS